ncbi:MAG: Ig-like domain-containing protein, partial [Firmicutes bacterium]|nr:Ig-like domain-containing protein [Bacillota bacterium]
MKKNKSKLFLVALVVLLTAFVFVACRNNNNESTYFTVTFVDASGTHQFADQTVETGGRVTPPQVVAIEGYTHSWHTANIGGQEWNFLTNTVTSDITLYLRRTPNVPVTGVTLATSAATLEIAGTYQLVATVNPTNATNQDVTWSSDDTAVAT